MTKPAGGNQEAAGTVTSAMPSLRRLRALAGVFAVLTVGLLSPGSVLASCAMPAPIAEALANADIVFVGTVTSTAERNLWATVTVEDVWKGPDLAAVVEVRGGQGGNVASSVDREFKVVKYLFVPNLQDGILTDNSCSPTMVWEEALTELRPSDAHPPIGGAPLEPAGFDLSGVIGPIGVALAVAVALLAVGLLARGRQSG